LHSVAALAAVVAGRSSELTSMHILVACEAGRKFQLVHCSRTSRDVALPTFDSGVFPFEWIRCRRMLFQPKR